MDLYLESADSLCFYLLRLPHHRRTTSRHCISFESNFFFKYYQPWNKNGNKPENI